MKEQILVGNIFQVLPLSKQLVDALKGIGLSEVQAAFWIYRKSIIFGGRDKSYDYLRRQMQELRGGDVI